jgi:hypothetical protein
MDKASLNINFCFDLVCQVVVGFQRSSIIIFIYMGVPHVQKTKGSFFMLFNFINLFHEFITFLSCHFVFLCCLITSLCYERMRHLHA